MFELDELADGMNASKPDDEMDREDEESIDTKNDENNSIDGDNHFQDVKEIGSADETALENDSFTYSASAGEDIYGRTTSGNQNEKYIPPSRRKIENLEVIAFYV